MRVLAVSVMVLALVSTYLVSSLVVLVRLAAAHVSRAATSRPGQIPIMIVLLLGLVVLVHVSGLGLMGTAMV